MRHGNGKGSLEPSVGATQNYVGFSIYVSVKQIKILFLTCLRFFVHFSIFAIVVFITIAVLEEGTGFPH